MQYNSSEARQTSCKIYSGATTNRLAVQDNIFLLSPIALFKTLICSFNICICVMLAWLQYRQDTNFNKSLREQSVIIKRKIDWAFTSDASLDRLRYVFTGYSTTYLDRLNNFEIFQSRNPSNTKFYSLLIYYITQSKQLL